jgi:hypothetical protein
MACGCKKRKDNIYRFLCLNCNESFNIKTSGLVVQKNGYWISKGVNITVLKHICGNTKLKRL